MIQNSKQIFIALILGLALSFILLGLLGWAQPLPAQANPLQAPQAQTQMVTLTPSKDNTMFNPDGTLSNGQGPSFFVGRTSGGGGNRVLRSLIAFDVAGGIPVGATIQSVTLRLNVPQGRGGARNIELHKVLADWGEGASFEAPGGGQIWANAQPGDATWTHAFSNTTTWATPGGDFSATVSAVTAVDSFGLYTWGSTAQMVADVQAWLDNPSNNFGWLLKMDDEISTQTAKRFASGENTTAANRPQLFIEYSLSPNLTLSKYVNNTIPKAGERITYTLVISNSGGGPATGALVTDPLHGDLTFIGPVTLDPPSAGMAGASPVLASNVTIDAGGQVTLTFPAMVKLGVVTGANIINTAAVTSAEVTTPQTGTVTVLVGGAKLLLPFIVKLN